MGWNLIAFSALLLLILTYQYFLWYPYHIYWYSHQFLDMNLIQMSEHQYECDVNGICNITATTPYSFDDTSQSHGLCITFLPYTSLPFLLLYSSSLLSSSGLPKFCRQLLREKMNMIKGKVRMCRVGQRYRNHGIVMYHQMNMKW